MNLLEVVEREQLRTDLPDLRVGDTVKVHVKSSKARRRGSNLSKE